ncbi:hypothetical protein RJ639_046199 [Escallonia herrerae]|uniref:Methionine gamma-lyase n=1 Tax=Escallonia herrerae TaxID=1293975 RepID=A0AA88WAZ0_9ASTE|nr:hypothetical protein RJ639_046199 [Escallonia herrerae]
MKPLTPIWEDPVAALANACQEFGEHGGVNMSIEASTTFPVMELETMRRLFSGELGPDRDFFIYSRHFNPTVLKLNRQMAALEGTEATYCTASGMSAISSVLMQLCSSGDHMVASQTFYGGMHILLIHFFPRACNITTSFVDLRDHDTVKTHDKGLTVVVDNTFAPMVLSGKSIKLKVLLRGRTVTGETLPKCQVKGPYSHVFAEDLLIFELDGNQHQHNAFGAALYQAL